MKLKGPPHDMYYRGTFFTVKVSEIVFLHVDPIFGGINMYLSNGKEIILPFDNPDESMKNYQAIVGCMEILLSEGENA